MAMSFGKRGAQSPPPPSLPPNGSTSVAQPAASPLLRQLAGIGAGVLIAFGILVFYAHAMRSAGRALEHRFELGKGSAITLNARDVVNTECKPAIVPRREVAGDLDLVSIDAALRHEANVVAYAGYLDCLTSRAMARLCEPASRRILIQDLSGYTEPRRNYHQLLADWRLVTTGTPMASVVRSLGVAKLETALARSASIVADADRSVIAAINRAISLGYLTRDDLGRATLPAEIIDRITESVSIERPCP